jgi:hypothetical protein
MEKLLTPIAITMILAVIGGMIYYRYFYHGTRRKPGYNGRHRPTGNTRDLFWSNRLGYAIQANVVRP